MAEMITLPTFSDARGTLTVLEKCLPFEIKRVYWMYGLNGEERGGHRHLKTAQAAMCLQGACTFKIIKHSKEESYRLDKPYQCLLLPPEDWHELMDFAPNTIVLLVASEEFDKTDYVLTPIE
jgi:dTDP-4-dehydrorhamnose 3,5-epimerase-like enzyme